MKKSWIFYSILLILMIGALIFYLNQDSKLSSGFDSELWKAQHNSGEHNNPRAGLVASLERDVLRVGMTQQEVRDILSPPERSEPQKDIYDLGVATYGIDFESYVIEYDEQLKVVKYYLMRS